MYKKRKIGFLGIVFTHIEGITLNPPKSTVFYTELGHKDSENIRKQRSSVLKVSNS